MERSSSSTPWLNRWPPTTISTNQATINPDKTRSSPNIIHFFFVLLCSDVWRFLRHLFISLYIALLLLNVKAENESATRASDLYIEEDAWAVDLNFLSTEQTDNDRWQWCYLQGLCASQRSNVLFYFPFHYCLFTFSSTDTQPAKCFSLMWEHTETYISIRTPQAPKISPHQWRFHGNQAWLCL